MRAADVQIREQRRRHFARRGGDDDAVDSEILAQCRRAVAVLDAHVVELERAQVAPSLRRPASRCARPCTPRRHSSARTGGLVATTGADLEHAAPRAACTQQLGHARHDVRLRNRLSGADRQRRVLVGADRQRFLDENMARHGAHRRQHDFVDDALLAQALDHARARARRSHADAVEFFDARDHAGAFCTSRFQPRAHARHFGVVRQVHLQRRHRHVAAFDRVEIGALARHRRRRPRHRPSSRSRRAGSAS